MTQKLYYQAPSDEIFNDMKQAAITVWKEVAHHPSYLKEKLDRIDRMQNISDNFMTILAMFDSNNMQRVGNIIN